jgi:hypothetical protein
MEVNMFRKFRPILVTAVILALLLAPGLVSTAQASSSPTHWAIVLSGGANYYNNHARYWNDLSEMYEILTDTYGYDEDNVFVLYADGNPPEADPDVDTGDIVWPTPGDPGYFPPYDSGNCWDAATDAHAYYPTDIIDYAATSANIDTVTDLIAASSHCGDTLFVFTTDHGGVGGTLNLWGESISAATFASHMDDVTTYCWRAFEMEQCYSGEMIPDLSGPNTAIATAAGNTTSCGAGSSLFYYDPFCYYFNAALKGEFPSPAGGGTVDPSAHSASDVTTADANTDGKVSFVEAYNYAYPLSWCDEDERYDDNGDGIRQTTGPMPAGGDGALGSVIFLGETTNPVADAGDGQIVEQAYYQGADVTLDGSGSSDPDGGAITYAWTWSGGSAAGVSPTVSLPLGTTTITLVVNDGILDSCCPDTVDVTVVDTTPPVLTVPADVTVEQESLAGTVVPLTASATDICDADVDIISDAPATFPLGMTTVTFVATDDSGNTASASMTVTVVDTTPPSVDAGPDITVEQETLAGTEVTLSASVSDICDPSPMIVWSHGPTCVFPLGDTTVTVTATDASGNVGSDTVVVHVVDTTPPELECVEAANPNGEKTPAGKGKGTGQNPDGFYQLFAYDICDPNPVIYIGTESDPYLFGPFESGITVKITEANGTPQCKPIGSANGEAGAVEYHIILPADPYVTVVDFSGNQQSCTTCLVPGEPK